MKRWTSHGLAVSALFAVVLALAVPSVVRLWYTVGTTIIPGLLVPVVSTYFPKLHIRPAFALGSMLVGWGIATGSFLYGQITATGGEVAYPLGIEPMIPGLVASVVVWGVGRIVSEGRAGAA